MTSVATPPSRRLLRGADIAEFRRALGYSQRRLSRALGIDYRTLQRLEARVAITRRTHALAWLHSLVRYALAHRPLAEWRGTNAESRLYSALLAGVPGPAALAWAVVTSLGHAETATETSAGARVGLPPG